MGKEVLTVFDHGVSESQREQFKKDTVINAWLGILGSQCAWFFLLINCEKKNAYGSDVQKWV